MLGIRRSIAVVLGIAAMALVAVSAALMAASVLYDVRWTSMLVGWRWPLPFGLGDPSMRETFWRGTILLFVCMVPGGIAATLADHVILPLWRRGDDSMLGDALPETS